MLTGKELLFNGKENTDIYEGTKEAFSIIGLITVISELGNASGDTPTKESQLVNSFRALNFSNLKHLCLGINGITENGLNDSLFYVLAVLSNTLESIYLHSNPIKDTGLKTFYNNMVAYGVTFPKLKRMNFGSCGLTDDALSVLKEIVKVSPKLVSLDLSSYKSTNYFGQLHNTFTDTNKIFEIAKHLKTNAINCDQPNKNFIGFQHALNAYDQAEVNKLVKDIAYQLDMNVNGIQYKNEDKLQSGMLLHEKLSKRELSEVTEPYPAIDYIHSVYRNTMKS